MQPLSFASVLPKLGVPALAARAGVNNSSSSLSVDRSRKRTRALCKFLSFPIFLAVAWLQIASTTAAAQTNFGSVNIGNSATSTATLLFPETVILGSISVVTQGAPGLDFSNAGTGTCAAGSRYLTGQSCTVTVNFKPIFAGERYGAVLLTDESGDPITAGNLVGTGVGPQIAFGPGIPAAIEPMVNGIALNAPFGVVTDGKGDLFIADSNNGRVVELPAGGGAPIVIDPIVNGVGLMTPGGIAVDGAGDLFIADLDGDDVIEVPAGGGPAVAINPTVNGIGLRYPCGMVIDAAGNLYIADVDNARLVEVPAGGGAPIALDPTVNGKALVYPVALALDSAGDLFIADEFANQVVEMPAGGGAAVAIDPTVNGLSLNEPYGITVDGAGDLFIVDSYNHRVVEVPAGGGAPTVVATAANGEGLYYPVGMASNSAGDLFVADAYNSRVVKVTRSQAPALNFAATSAGSTSSDSPQTVQVQNTGNAPLSFPISATGNNPSITANFTLTSNGASDCPLLTPSSSAPGVLPAGATCGLPIGFAPVSNGSAYGVLTLTDNSLNATAPGYAVQSIFLSGNAPVASLSVTSLFFSPQQLGTTSASQQVTLTNTGSAALANLNLALTGAAASSFVLTHSCASSLAAGANCVLQVQFTPAAQGGLTATVGIADNASGSPQTIALVGNGVYPATVTVYPSPSSITRAQPLSVTVTVGVGNGNRTPTGSVTLTSGIYTSLPATLIGGSATITVPGGSLAVGTDSILAAYTPDAASALIYAGASASSSVVVTAVPTATAPAVATGAAAAVSYTSATLAATVNPNGADTHAWFLYGSSVTLSGASQTASVDLGSVTALDTVSAPLSGLAAGTTYYYQVVAQNSVGTTSGAVASFDTPDWPYFSVFTGTAISVAPGAASGNTTSVTIAPFEGFLGTVNLSCAIAPTAASDPPVCSLPASVSIGDVNAQTVLLTVTTTAATAARNSAPRFWPGAGGAILACMVLIGIPARRRNWRGRLGGLMLLIALGSGALSCGGSGNVTGGGGGQGNPGTTAGNYTVTITGISGSTTATGRVALTVQ